MNATPDESTGANGVDGVNSDAPPDDGGVDGVISGDIVPRPRPGHRTPPRRASLGLQDTLSAWAPVVAGMLRGVAGIVAYAASLLVLPVHVATPFLVGVSLVMLVGGCVATLRATGDDARIKQVGRGFCVLMVAIVVGSSATAWILGPGAFAPDVKATPRPPPADGTIQFQP